MDTRDRHLNRHMKMRMQLAADLPAVTQYRWARKSVAIARQQGRTAFFLMAHLWLTNVSATYPALTDVHKQDTQGPGSILRREEAFGRSSVPENSLALS